MTDRVSQGDPLRIRAETWNSILDARDIVLNPRPGLGTGVDLQASSRVVRILNDSDQLIAAGETLGIYGALLDPASNAGRFVAQPVLKGELPSWSTAAMTAVVYDPITPGRAGRAILAGLAGAKVRRHSSSDQFADIEPGSPVLASYAEGAHRILWSDGGANLPDGVEWCLIAVHGGSARRRIYAEITGWLADGPNRWLYAWAERQRETVGYEGFAAPSAARTSAQLGGARNFLEVPNASAGIQGNGVDTANLPAGFTIRPITPGVVVSLELIVSADGTVEPWFSIPNGVDGSCA